MLLPINPRNCRSHRDGNSGGLWAFRAAMAGRTPKVQFRYSVELLTAWALKLFGLVQGLKLPLYGYYLWV
jgi:hypothetical protein